MRLVLRAVFMVRFLFRFVQWEEEAGTDFRRMQRFEFETSCFSELIVLRCYSLLSTI
jgi:hypothetical protein